MLSHIRVAYPCCVILGPQVKSRPNTSLSLTHCIYVRNTIAFELLSFPLTLYFDIGLDSFFYAHEDSKTNRRLHPGFWEGGAPYLRICSVLQDLHVYPTAIAMLPSTGASSAEGASYTKDVAAIRKVIESRVTEGKRVILVGHADGATIGYNAIEGLGAQEQAVKGGQGGVSKIVFWRDSAGRNGISISTFLITTSK